MKKITQQFGFTLIEIILAIAIVTFSAAGVYMLMKSTEATANVEREIGQMSALVDGIQGTFVSDGSYDGLTTDTVLNSNIPGIRRGTDALTSAFGTPVEIRPSTVRVENDAFDVVYQQLSTAQCLRLTNALYQKSFQIIVGEAQTDVQATNGPNEGRLASSDVLSSACSQDSFESNQGEVAFRIYRRGDGPLIEPVAVCACQPTTEDRRASCAPGFSGTVLERRSSTCTGGTAECPVAVWSAWTTVEQTCVPDGGPTIIVNPVVDPGHSCLPRRDQDVQPCPAGFTGTVQQERDITCDAAGNEIVGPWTMTNMCIPIDPPGTLCEASTQRSSAACPAGQGGSILRERQSTCPDPYAEPVWGAWIEIENTCSASCALTGNCCVPSREERPGESLCPAGTYGFGSSVEQRTSVCSTPTGEPVWGGWIQLSSTSSGCSTCPTTTAEERRWVADTESCTLVTNPGMVSAGCWLSGAGGYVQDVTSSCFLGPVCAFEIDTTYQYYRSAMDPGGTWIPIPGGSSCDRAGDGNGSIDGIPGFGDPSGTGVRTFEREQVRTATTTYLCPAGTTALDSPSTNYTAWTDTGARRNESSTCEPAASTCVNENYRIEVNATVGRVEGSAAPEIGRSAATQKTNGPVGINVTQTYNDPIGSGMTYAVFTYDISYNGESLSVSGADRVICVGNTCETASGTPVPVTGTVSVGGGTFRYNFSTWYRATSNPSTRYAEARAAISMQTPSTECTPVAPLRGVWSARQDMGCLGGSGGDYQQIWTNVGDEGLARMSMALDPIGHEPGSGPNLFNGTAWDANRSALVSKTSWDFIANPTGSCSPGDRVWKAVAGGCMTGTRYQGYECLEP